MIGSVELVQSTGPIFKTLLFLLHSKSFLKSFLHHIPNLGGFERGSQWKAQIVGGEVPHSTSQNLTRSSTLVNKLPRKYRAVQKLQNANSNHMKANSNALKAPSRHRIE